MALVNDVQLLCGTCGNDAVLLVSIAADTNLSALQAAIAATMRLHGWPNVDARGSTLYVTQENGVWLARDAHVTQRLLDPLDDAANAELLSVGALSKCLQDVRSADGKDVVHVLIKLRTPERKATKRPRSTDDAQEEEQEGSVSTAAADAGCATEFQLGCAVYGDIKNAFFVSIARSATVYALKEAIVKLIKDEDGSVTVHPDKLKLFVARRTACG